MLQEPPVRAVLSVAAVVRCGPLLPVPLVQERRAQGPLEHRPQLHILRHDDGLANTLE